MKKGDIILLPFPFSDLTGNKLRPALILAVNRKDVVVAFITTNKKLKSSTDVFVNPMNSMVLKNNPSYYLIKLLLLTNPWC